MKLPRTFYNYISYLGAITAGIAWITLIFFVIQIYFFKIDNVYFDLWAFIVTPAFLVTGHILVDEGLFATAVKSDEGSAASRAIERPVFWHFRVSAHKIAEAEWLALWAAFHGRHPSGHAFFCQLDFRVLLV